MLPGLECLEGLATGVYAMQLSINDQAFTVNAAEGVRDTLASVGPQPFREIWINADGGRALCALLNGERGFLMYLRMEGDAGFTSRNPAFTGHDTPIEYRLRNGQEDKFPTSWALREDVIIAALEYFVSHEDKAPFVTWHDDGA